MSMDGNHVAPTKNSTGQKLILAVNCSKGQLNATGANGKWKNWASPKEEFEYNLLEDLCRAREKPYKRKR